MSTSGKGTKWRTNNDENFNRLSRVHKRYKRQTTDRQTTDGRTMTYSERECVQKSTYARTDNCTNILKTHYVPFFIISLDYDVPLVNLRYVCLHIA